MERFNVNVKCDENCEKEVLLVDDVPFNLVPLEMYCNELNLKYTSVYTGSEAASLYFKRLNAQCCQRFFKIVITDI